MAEIESERIHYDRQFCKHRRVIAKRWTEAGVFHAIIRCRWCDEPWTRKSIVLDQDSRKGLKLITQKFIENGPIGPGNESE